MAQDNGLREILGRCNSLGKICSYARDRAKQDLKFVRETFDIQIIGEKVKDEQQFLLDYFSKLQTQVFESSFLEVVASFERITCAKIGNTLGIIRKVVEDNYPSEEPFSTSTQKFIRERKEIDNLAAVKMILKNRISTTLQDKLTEIIDYRDHLAHGKRFGKETNLSIEEVVSVLEEVLERIRG